MPYVLGDYERLLLSRGHIVATKAGRSFKCKCGEPLHLSREINGEGQAKPATFYCFGCKTEISIYPDSGGGVQPALKIKMGFARMRTESSFGKEVPRGYDPLKGGWQ